MPRPRAACCQWLALIACKSSSATLLLLSPKSAYWRSLDNSCLESGKRSECHDSADLRRIQRASLICATVAAAVAVAIVAALNSQLGCKCNDTSSRQVPPPSGVGLLTGRQNYRRRKPNGMQAIILMMNSSSGSRRQHTKLHMELHKTLRLPAPQ